MPAREVNENISPEEHAMRKDRRTFLQATGAVALAAGSGGPGAQAQTGTPTRPRPQGEQPAPKGLTYATIQTSGGYSLGLRTEKGVLDVKAAEAALKLGAPTTVDAVIRQEGDLSALAKLVEQARSGGEAAKHLIPEAQVKFGPAVTNPPKVLCIGLNYRAHVAEANQQIPTTPIFFNKFTTSLNAHGGTIAVSKEHAKNFDYEGELALVMAKGGRNISEDAALDHVFGYTVGHDFSARDLQMATSQWMMGKAGDGWGPIGPWLVSADQIDPQNLNIQTKVNGEVRQSSNTSRMIFNIRQQIAYLSKHMTLEPGDVIFTGTPEGVISGYPKDKQVWLKAGDKITTSIEKLGDQEFTLV
jgi:2-keto-4-pentenoate hydratase/2-oxohepta-3-ene-1,7-dioic acid hydratase in catechol pathway